ncbi:MAG: type sorting protein [Ferruginibacter sp.]|nr:type sorting protein [Ferruginibacter sp.]
MKKFYSRNLIAALICTVALFSCSHGSSFENEDEENEEYDGPELMAQRELDMTKDPATGKIPRQELIDAMYQTDQVKREIAPYFISAYGNWTERGPNSDVTGPSNGNFRQGNAITSGRIRGVLVDKADATGNTVFAAGVDGGIWKTTNYATPLCTWVPINDFLSNLAVTNICQDPTNLDIMYFGTGEAFLNADAVSGNGVFKSTDHGATWTQLAATTAFTTCTKIACDALGNLYVGTRTLGLQRSNNGGASFSQIATGGFSASISDFEFSSTGRLHLAQGYNTTIGTYRYTDDPANVTPSTWTIPTVATLPYPSGGSTRVEMGCMGTTLYALIGNTAGQVTQIYKTVDNGDTWALTTGVPASGWASGQAWYALAIDVNPADANQVIVGGLDCYRTLDGGATWSQISKWVNNPPTALPFIHADVHAIKWYDNGNKVIVSSDGGMFYSGDGGTTFTDRNTGLRIKQFYSLAIHPTTTNYFLAGAQDNGVHQFNNAGLSGTIEVTGGDGALVAIDQDEPLYQVGSYVYNRYRKSTNGGVSWTSINIFKGTNTDFGQFINPFDYDNRNNVLYAASSANEYLRITNIQTLSGGTYTTGSGLPAGMEIISSTTLGGSVSAVFASPYTNNRVYFGTTNGRLTAVDNAHTVLTATAAGTNITGAGFSGNISCINTGTTDNNLIVSFSNYGVNNVWVTADGGTNWSQIDGNLPNMPVRWCMFVPGDNSRAIIATETGVWLTQLINDVSTVWLPSPTFPTVRTDQIKYRSSDGLLAAATHGRGVWSQPLLSVVPVNDFTLRGKWLDSKTAELIWDYTSQGPTTGSLEIEVSYDGSKFVSVGSVTERAGKSSYRFTHIPQGAKVVYRIKGTSASGMVKYSNNIRLQLNGTSGAFEITSIFPNPVKDNLKVAFSTAAKGNISYTITAANGQVIWRKEEANQFTGNFIKEWNIATVKPGNYYLTIRSGTDKATKAFTKL